MTTLERVTPTGTQNPTCALYARISLDDKDDEKGIERQLEDARAFAEQHGWTVFREYRDNNISALKGKTRTDYQELMRDAAGGCFDRVVVYHTSRLTRNRLEKATVIHTFGRLGIGIFPVLGPALDLTTASGRMIAGVMGEFDAMESEIKGERVARAALQRAQEGRANGAVLYGWRRTKEEDASGRVTSFHDEEKPEEADVVREVTRRLLSGDTLHAITADLNERGVPTPMRQKHRSKQWIRTTLRLLVLRPANVGLRVYHGKVLGPAAWPAILEQDDYDRVVALLSAPERQKHRDASRKHLLTYGIGECGVCHGVLRAAVKTMGKGRKPQPTYVCDQKACVARSQVQVDAFVEKFVLEYLSRPEAAEVFAEDVTGAREAQDRVDAIRARLDTAALDFAEEALDGRQLKIINAKLQPELAAAEAEVQRFRKPALPDAADRLLQRDQAESAWADLTVTARRTIMQAIGLKVEIMPRTKRGPGFEPETVKLSVNGVLLSSPG